MTRSSNRRVVVALAVWGALTGTIGTYFISAAAPSAAHDCVSPMAGTPVITVQPWGSCNYDLDTHFCQGPGMANGNVAAQVAFCVHTG